MKPIDINIRRSEKEASDVDFASQEKDKWDLGDRDPCRSKSHTFPVICVVDNRPGCQEDGDNNPVREYDQGRP